MDNDPLKPTQVSLKTKTFTWISYLTLLIAAGFILTAGWWLTRDYDPLLVKNEPVPVIGRNIEPGDYVILDIDYCKNVSVHRIIHIALVSSSTKLQLPDIDGISIQGCHRLQVPFPIPTQAAPDIYHFEFTAEYDVNPLRTVEDGFKSSQFKVN